VKMVKWVAGFLLVDVAIGVGVVVVTRYMKKRRMRNESPRY